MFGRRLTAVWDVVQVKDGAVVCRSASGKQEYLGADCFWTRSPENATPFATRDEAERVRADAAEWEAR